VIRPSSGGEITLIVSNVRWPGKSRLAARRHGEWAKLNGWETVPTTDSITVHNIRARSHLLQLLGEELIGDDRLAVFELVRTVTMRMPPA